VNIESKSSTIESLTQLTLDKNGAVIDRIDTSQMTCNPSECNRFPLRFSGIGEYRIEIIAKAGNKEENVTFDVDVRKQKYGDVISFQNTELKKYKILIAINEEYYNSKSKDFIDSNSKELVDYINSIFSKNTKLRFDYIGTISYNDASLNDNFNQNLNSPNRPQSFSMAGNSWGDKYLDVVFQKDKNIFDTPSDSNVQQDYGAVIHELGHSFSLALPEQYFYLYYDCNPNKPKLDYFNIFNLYPYDPMNLGSQYINKEDFMFSEYNALQLNNEEITMNTESQIAYLKVVDSNKNAVETANVSMYCLRKLGYFSSDNSCNIEDEYNFNKLYRDSIYSYTYEDLSPNIGLTDSNGIIKIPFENGCLAYSIKAEFNGKNIETYVNIMDARYFKFLYNQSVYIRGLVLN
jgi:hypothetical protein